MGIAEPVQMRSEEIQFVAFQRSWAAGETLLIYAFVFNIGLISSLTLRNTKAGISRLAQPLAVYKPNDMYRSKQEVPADKSGCWVGLSPASYWKANVRLCHDLAQRCADV